MLLIRVCDVTAHLFHTTALASSLRLRAYLGMALVLASCFESG